MNVIKHNRKNSEKLSLEKMGECLQNGVLYQKHIAVKPYRQNWLFLRPNTTKGTGVNPSYPQSPILAFVCFMVWLILQNKPIGEYAKRLLYVPRVRPHHPFLGLFTQNHIGVFNMKTNPIFSKPSLLSPIQRLVVGLLAVKGV